MLISFFKAENLSVLAVRPHLKHFAKKAEASVDSKSTCMFKIAQRTVTVGNCAYTRYVRENFSFTKPRQRALKFANIMNA